MDYTDSSTVGATQPSDPCFGEAIDFGNQQNSSYRLKSSKFRGVQRIKGKETFVAHVYDNGHSPKDARTIYLGRFENEENAARAHDLVSLKFWGPNAQTNFPVSDYSKELESMAKMSDHDVMVDVRRSSNSFSRGKSKYRGVVKHANSGKWQARKGPGKDSFLGTFDTEEEAAMAFDIASIRLKGFKAITNFDIKTYNIPAILEGETELEQEQRNDDDHVSAVNVGPESSRAGNRRNKRGFSLRHFLRKHTEMVPPRKCNTGGKDPAVSTSSDPDTSLSLGFKHSDPRFEHGNSELCPSRETGLSKNKEPDGVGIGFRHASSSLFKPFRKMG